MGTRRALVFCIVGASLSAQAMAATERWVRHIPGNGEYGDIATALAASADGDVVIVAATVPLAPYSGTGFSGINFAGKKVTIRSEAGPASCEIDLSEVPGASAFIFESGESAESVLQGFSFNGHFGEEGVETASAPVIACISSSPRIVNCRFVTRATTGVSGAAISCASRGNPVITHCEFVENEARAQFSAGKGGAIGIDASSSPVIQNSVFRGNRTQEKGGAIYAGNDFATDGCRPVIANCIFENNYTERGGDSNDFGGALYFENVNPSISNCLVFGSSDLDEFQADNGSAIALAGNARASIINCTIADTRARDSTDIVQIYFSGDASATLTNCILYDRYTGSTPHVPSSGFVLKFCDFEGGPGTPDSNGNFGLNPQYYPRPDPPPGQTDLWAHNYYLGDSVISGQTNSPCRNAGGTSGGQTATAEEIGLAHLSTRTDLVIENAASQVDLGFHITSDCNGNSQFDSLDILLGTVFDVDPSEDEWLIPTRDCNYNGIPDLCDIESGTSPDTNADHVPDNCQCKQPDWDVTDDNSQNLGFMINVHRDANGRLIREEIAKPIPYLGVALGRDVRAVRIRTTASEEGVMAHYRLTPEGTDSKVADTTAVDLDGFLWVAYQKGSGVDAGGVTQLGLIVGGERCDGNGITDPNGAYLRSTVTNPILYNTCQDRNGDGLIATSAGLEDLRCWSLPSGVMPAEAIAFADDECICRWHLAEPDESCNPSDWYLRASHPAHLSVDKSNNLWIGGKENRVFDYLDTTTDEFADCFAPPPNVGGFGGVVDYNGVLWSATDTSASGSPYNGMLRCDISSQTREIIGDDVPAEAPTDDTVVDIRGIAVDYNGNIWTSRCGHANELFRYTPDGDLDGPPISSGDSSHNRSIAITFSNNYLWIPNGTNCSHDPSGESISRVNPAVPTAMEYNLHLPNETGDLGPTGIAIDQDEMVWVTCHDTYDVRRVDPASDPSGAVTEVVSVYSSYDQNAEHYAPPSSYSDQTGQVTLHNTGVGTYTVVHDSGAYNAFWHRALWNQTSGCPSSQSDTRLTIEVRASDVRAELALLPYVTPNANGWFHVRGRYIETRVRFFGSGPGQVFSSPTLCDLTLMNRVGDMNCDGLINNFDTDAFSLAITSGEAAYQAEFPNCYYWLADCNGDGRVNNFDIDAFVSILVNNGLIEC